MKTRKQKERELQAVGTETMTAPLTLMTIHAHPDDEAIGTGGILKKYAAEGVRTVVVLATKGESGEIHGRLPKPEEKDRVVKLRLEELECSRHVLNVQALRFMDYRDSGMAGTPENHFPGAFAAADPDEATKRLVKIIREERPHVITTYNEKGTYGHPDHIATNRITVRAFHESGDGKRYRELNLSPWQPLKLYYQAIPISRIRRMANLMKDRAQQLGIDPEFMGTEDGAITSWVDIHDVLEDKFMAICCHKSQVGENSFFNQFTERERQELFAHECFLWIAGEHQPHGKETDLFEGMRASHHHA